MSRLTHLWGLARRYPFCGVCGIASLVFLLGSLLLWARLHTLSKVQHARQIEGEAVQATLISAPQLRQELAFVQQTMQRITQNLSTEDDLAVNINYFYDMEGPSKARVDDIRPFNSPAPDTGVAYKRIPFGLKVSGTFPQVAAFLHAVETGPRPCAITYFSFRKRPGTATIVVEFNVDLLGSR